MKIKILVLGITCYEEQELKEIVSLLETEFNVFKLPSNETYSLFAIRDEEEEDITLEMEDLSSSHSNPAWEIISREFNNNSELQKLADVLVLEER